MLHIETPAFYPVISHPHPHPPLNEWCNIRYKELYNTVLTEHLNAIISKQLNVLVASESRSATPPTIGHCASD